MRRIILITVAVISAMACHSCIHKEVKLEDKSILTSVEIVIEDETQEWTINTSRRIKVVYKPTDAVITDIRFEYDSSLLTFEETREQYVYDVTAKSQGTASIMAVVNGVRSKMLSFLIIDNRPVKEQPRLELYKISDGYYREICTTEFYCNYGDELHLTACSMIEGSKYSFYSADENVLMVKWKDEANWIVAANTPGQTDILITMTEPDGTQWTYTYEVIVYGHIRLESKCNPLDRTAGFLVGEHPLGRLTGDFYITLALTGWTDQDPKTTHVVKIEPYSQIIPLETEADYCYIIDINDAVQDIYNKGYMLAPNGDKHWWVPKVMDMHFVISLDNPYIIIDKLIDDSDRMYPDFINFFTNATFEQTGVAKFIESPSTDNSLSSWISQDIYINLN